LKKVPIIDITDLYFPPQDVGDNFDIVAAYALPEVELKAVILDATEKFRQPIADDMNPMFRDMRGIGRDPGLISIAQMNYIFDRDVPAAAGPFTTMADPEDKLEHVPKFQQKGIQLLMNALRNSEEKVQILSFGSARALAAAYNREPDLLRRKVERVHLAAGSSSGEFMEWNVLLDPNAIVCLLKSDLPIDIYPCATGEGPFAYGHHNTYWNLDSMSFIKDMAPRLRRYLGFAIGHVQRLDYLRALDEDLPDSVMEAVYRQSHHVWETAIWAQVAGLKLARSADGTYRLKRQDEIVAGDVILREEMRPCRLKVEKSGAFEFEYTDGPSNFRIYYRENYDVYETAMRQALPQLYKSLSH